MRPCSTPLRFKSRLAALIHLGLGIGMGIGLGFTFGNHQANGQTNPPSSATDATAAAAATQNTASPSPPPGREAAKEGSVWGALVYATSNRKDTSPTKDPEDFPNLSKRLAKAFQYDHFEVLGQHTQVVFREYESWVVPSREVFLKLDSKGSTQDGGLNLHLQFWQGQQVLVKSDTILRPGSPLFIGGPNWREGRLIFVLELKETGKGK